MASGRLVPVHVLVRGHVQVAQQDLLVAQREVGDDPGADLRLGGLQGVGVLERVLLERHRGQFLGEPLAEVLRRHEVEVGLEDVLVHRRSASSCR